MHVVLGEKNIVLEVVCVARYKALSNFLSEFWDQLDTLSIYQFIIREVASRPMYSTEQFKCTTHWQLQQVSYFAYSTRSTDPEFTSHRWR